MLDMNKGFAGAVVALGALLVLAAFIGGVHAQSNMPAMFGTASISGSSFNCGQSAYGSNYLRSNIDPPMSNAASQGCVQVDASSMNYAPVYAPSDYDSFNTNSFNSNSFNTITDSYNTNTQNTYAGYNGLYTSSPYAGYTSGYSYNPYSYYGYGSSYPYYTTGYSFYAPYVSSNVPSWYFYYWN